MNIPAARKHRTALHVRHRCPSLLGCDLDGCIIQESAPSNRAQTKNSVVRTGTPRNFFLAAVKTTAKIWSYADSLRTFGTKIHFCNLGRALVEITVPPVAAEAEPESQYAAGRGRMTAHLLSSP